MSTEYVTIGRTSAGAHGRAPPGDPVEVPVEGLCDGRGLITGAPDSGVDETTAILAESLLAADQSVLLVDGDGSHRNLARRHGARLAGNDADCDVRMSRGNAERIATIVTERDESVVLDCSSFAADAGEALRSIAESLGRSRGSRSPVVVILTDCHEWLPDAGESRCADALDALGRVDTGPGVGVVGVTDRPSGVDSGYRRDCDWIVAHRVTWRDHVNAVVRILGRQYADALEDLDDGEAFLDGPWTSGVQRLRFEHPESDRAASTTPVSRGTQRNGHSNDHETVDGRTAQAAAVAALSDEVAALSRRIDELESTLDERNDVGAIAGDLAETIADRLDDSAVPAADTPRSTGDGATPVDAVEAGDSSSNGTADESVAAGGGFGAVFDAFDDPTGPSDSNANRQTASSTGPQTSADTTGDGGDDGSTDDSGGMSFEPANFAFDEGVTGGEADLDGLSPRPSRRSRGERRVPRYVRDLVRTVEEMDPTTRHMLAHYVDRGADTPMNAYFAAGGSGDRTRAYAHNRQLRTTGFVEHVGRGHYAPTIPEKVRETADVGLSTEAIKKATEHIRRALP